MSERATAGAVAVAQGDGVVRDEFDGAVLGPEWNSLRGPVDGLVSLESGGGGAVEGGTGEARSEKAGLRIRLSPDALTSTGTPAFLARRQQHVRMRARTRVHLAATAPSQEAGLAVFQNHHQHATLALTADTSGTPQVVLTTVEAGTATRLAAITVTDDEVVLAVDSDESDYTFRVEAGTGATLGSIERSFFSTERAGGFVGVHLGLYGTGGTTTDAAEAHVRWFEYAPGQAGTDG
nr:hypothetical protein [Streptomyces sp. SID13726]